MATDRRRFVAAGLAAAGLSACSKKKDAGAAGSSNSGGPLHVFTVENGQLGQAGFSIGLLATHDPAALVMALATLRRQTKFRTDLSFASTNRWKLKYIEPAFQHLVGSGDALLASVTVTGFTDWARQPAAKQFSAYASLYQHLFEALPAGQRARMVAHLSRRSSGGARDGKLQAELRRALGAGVTVAIDGERFKDLVELASVVFGSVRYGAGPGRSKTKRRTVELLQAALKVPHLDAGALNAAGRLRTSSLTL